MQNKKHIELATLLRAATVLLSLTSAHGRENKMTPEETKKWIKNVFAEVVENPEANESTYRKYFAKDYVQYVDGTKMALTDFIDHMAAQKRAVRQLKVDFKYILVDRNQIATLHMVEGTRKDGSQIKIQVNAFFQVRSGQITLCDELTHLIQGEQEDADLGSRK